MSKEKPKEGVKAENDHINLKVAGQDGSVVHFKIKRHSPLGKLMKAYCEQQGLSMRQIRFRFDVQPSNEAGTLAQLKMKDQDPITCSSSRQEALRSLAASWDAVSRRTDPTLSLSMHLLLNSEHVTMPIMKESAGTKDIHPDSFPL